MLTVLWFSCALTWLFWPRRFEKHCAGPYTSNTPITELLTSPYPRYVREHGCWALETPLHTNAQFLVHWRYAKSSQGRFRYHVNAGLGDDWLLNTDRDGHATADWHSLLQLQTGASPSQVYHVCQRLLALPHPTQPHRPLVEAISAGNGVLSMVVSDRWLKTEMAQAQKLLLQLAEALQQAPAPSQFYPTRVNVRHSLICLTMLSCVLNVAWSAIQVDHAAPLIQDSTRDMVIGLGLIPLIVGIYLSCHWWFRRQVWIPQRWILAVVCAMPLYMLVANLAWQEMDWLTATSATTEQWRLINRQDHYIYDSERGLMLQQQTLLLRQPNSVGVLDVNSSQLSLQPDTSNATIPVTYRRGGFSNRILVCRIGPHTAVSKERLFTNC